MTVSKSPDRYTFQINEAIKSSEVTGKKVSESYLDFWKSAKQQDASNILNPAWQKDNLEYNLRSTDWILEKVRNSDSYAQNLYAAMCNNEFIKLDIIPILKDQQWSCSWRHAGGIIADMREQGDYVDWYCSGIADHNGGYVNESVVTEEIQKDLKKLGWLIVDQTNDSSFS